MYKIIFLCTSILFCLISCETEKAEDPYSLAIGYCNCLERQMKNAEDSSVNVYDCEKTIYEKSRFMQIESSENRGQYTKATLDSAFHFLLQVRNITDTMCFNKINWKKVKKIPHIKM